MIHDVLTGIYSYNKYLPNKIKRLLTQDITKPQSVNKQWEKGNDGVMIMVVLVN